MLPRQPIDHRDTLLSIGGPHVSQEFSQEGTITCWARHTNKEWHADPHTYTFPTTHARQIAMSLTKRPDGNLVAILSNVLGKPEIVIEASLRGYDLNTNGAIFVAVTWSSAAIKLFVNGRQAAAIDSNALNEPSSSVTLGLASQAAGATSRRGKGTVRYSMTDDEFFLQTIAELQGRLLHWRRVLARSGYSRIETTADGCCPTSGQGQQVTARPDQIRTLRAKV